MEKKLLSFGHKLLVLRSPSLSSDRIAAVHCFCNFQFCFCFKITLRTQTPDKWILKLNEFWTSCSIVFFTRIYIHWRPLVQHYCCSHLVSFNPNIDWIRLGFTKWRLQIAISAKHCPLHSYVLILYIYGSQQSSILRKSIVVKWLREIYWKH